MSPTKFESIGSLEESTLFRSTAPESTTAGFTLIEVLVALSIVAVSLSSIGALIATTVRGTRSIEGHFTRLETAQAIVTAIPDREQLVLGNVLGVVGDHRLRINVSPFMTSVGTRQSMWVPQAIAITVQTPAGGILQINTVRLHQRAGG